MGQITNSNSIEGRMPDQMTAKRNRARVGPAAQDNSMDRVQEEGRAFFSGGDGNVFGSVNKERDGDESVSMSQRLGGRTGSWQMKLDQGSDSPYPDTPEALKTKNTRKNNDGFFPG